MQPLFAKRLRGLGALLLGSLALAAAASDDALREYREMFGDDNPAALWEARGEQLWQTARGPQHASLAACDLGLGPGVVKGAYAKMPRWFADTARVEDLESRLLTCMTELQGFPRDALLKTRFGDGERKSDLEALAAYVVGASRGAEIRLPLQHPAEQAAWALGQAAFYYRAGPHDFSCATCHARREEFDEHFTTGRSFHDHYQLALPSQPGLWFPDGQQLDEDYNFTSLLLSRMGHKGIGCTDCHDPHAAIPKGGDVAVRSNALCMSCHAGGTQGAVVIDPATHTLHATGTPGAGCVDCHMPKRSYMGRDPRSDHRFPRPDPLLTKELGVPNACNDCHSDKGIDWQIKHTHEWYGEDMNRVNRQRTRAIHAAQQGRTGALDLLVEAMRTEEIDAWQATLLRLMEPWATESRVVRFTNVAIQQGGPLARSAAAMLIGRRGESGELLDKALADPLKAVRVEAGWAALERLPRDHPVITELEQIATHQSDQPGGAMRLARIAMSRGETTTAEAWMKKAADWDRTSPAPRRDLAVFLGGIGRTAESIRWLEEAAALEPGNPEIVYLAALAHAETGDSAKAEEKLRKAVEIDPSYSRAWYNLGLLLAGGERVEEAMECLIRAEKTDPGSADAPYARATILYRLGRLPEARTATLEALRRQPEHPPANQLIQELGGR